MIDGRGLFSIIAMCCYQGEHEKGVSGIIQGVVRVFQIGVGLWTILVVGFLGGCAILGLESLWDVGLSLLVPMCHAKTIQRGPILSSNVPQGCRWMASGAPKGF